MIGFEQTNKQRHPQKENKERGRPPSTSWARTRAHPAGLHGTTVHQRLLGWAQRGALREWTDRRMAWHGNWRGLPPLEATKKSHHPFLFFWGLLEPTRLYEF